MRKMICPSCAGKMRFNENKNIIECESCGTVFDYDYFKDDSLVKLGYAAIANGEFVAAKSFFDMHLKNNPSDFMSVRGKFFSDAHIKDISELAPSKSLYVSKLDFEKYKTVCTATGYNYFSLCEETNRISKKLNRLEALKNDAAKKYKAFVDKANMIIKEDYMPLILSNPNDLLVTVIVWCVISVLFFIIVLPYEIKKDFQLFKDISGWITDLRNDTYARNAIKEKNADIDAKKLESEKYDSEIKKTDKELQASIAKLKEEDKKLVGESDLTEEELIEASAVTLSINTADEVSDDISNEISTENQEEVSKQETVSANLLAASSPRVYGKSLVTLDTLSESDIEKIFSYICPSCAGKLTLSDNKELICNSCGSAFEYSYFEENKLIKKAEEFRKNRNFKASLNCYDFLLTKVSDSAPALRGKLLSSLKIADLNSIPNDNIYTVIKTDFESYRNDSSELFSKYLDTFIELKDSADKFIHSKPRKPSDSDKPLSFHQENKTMKPEKPGTVPLALITLLGIIGSFFMLPNHLTLGIVILVVSLILPFVIGFVLNMVYSKKLSEYDNAISKRVAKEVADTNNAYAEQKRLHRVYKKEYKAVLNKLIDLDNQITESFTN